MEIEIINHSKQKIILDVFLKAWVRRIVQNLRMRKIKILTKKLTLAFITENEMKKLNHDFRGQDKATDVLSFSSWEIALCPQYIKRKATLRKISVREETAYLVLHGLLHLLGFDHEKDNKQAQKMYNIQDDVFKKCWRKNFSKN